MTGSRCRWAGWFCRQCLCCGLLLAWAVAWAAPVAEPLTARVGVESNYGPFVYADEQGVPRGLSVELLNQVAELASLQLAFGPARPLQELLDATRRGEIDLLTSLRPTPERSAFLAFTRPYVRVPAALVVAGDTQLHSLAELAGQPVAVGQGYAVQAYLLERFPQVRWAAAADDLQALRSLRAGAVRAVVADVASVHFIRRSQGWDDIHLRDPVGFDYALCFAYRPDRPELGVALERGLQRLGDTARLQLLRRWVPDSEWDTRDERRRQLGALAAALVLAALALVWWLYRRRKVVQGSEA